MEKFYIIIGILIIFGLCGMDYMPCLDGQVLLYIF